MPSNPACLTSSRPFSNPHSFAIMLSPMAFFIARLISYDGHVQPNSPSGAHHTSNAPLAQGQHTGLAPAGESPAASARSVRQTSMTSVARHAAGVLTVIATARGAAQTPPLGQRTYANPIDIDYRYNFEQKNQAISYRSGADPVIVVHRGDYYLFETIGDGYWQSHDLGTWRHITPTRWPLTDVVAPAALAVRDTIYLLPATTSPLPILMLTEPATGRVEFYNRLLPPLPLARARETDVLAKPDSVQPGPWDPAFFYDPDTGRWFLYWNSSSAYPLHVIELDRTKQLAYRGTPKWLFGLEPEKHGWERFGQDNRDTTTRPWIGVNWNFERRIGLHPAGFDSDGQMYVDTRFGDLPHWLPTRPWGTSEELFTGWMLLSYRKSTTASSALDSFPSSYVTDENPRTFWVPTRSRPG